MLLEKFDYDKSAVIEPWFVHQPVEGFPETVVSIFHHTLFYRIAEFLGGEEIARTKDVDGHWPVYAVSYKGKRFALYKARLGALGSPSLARFCNTETRVSIANGENTKVYVIKEPKLLVQTMDGVEN